MNIVRELNANSVKLICLQCSLKYLKQHSNRAVFSSNVTVVVQ